MSPFWIVVCLGIIAAALVAARILDMREKKAATQETRAARDTIRYAFELGDRAYTELDSIGHHLSVFLATPGAGVHHQARSAFESALEHLEQAHDRLSGIVADVRAGNTQMQEALGLFSRHYSEFALQLGDVAQKVGHEIAVDENYRNWLADDRRFSHELWRLAARPDFLPLSKGVRAFVTAEGFAASRSLRRVIAPGEAALENSGFGTDAFSPLDCASRLSACPGDFRISA
jgi:hypothetical protein